MEWFSGGVVKAIAECRKDSSLFIVYVHDDSQASKTTEGVWNTPKVQEVLSYNKYVALKISKDSVEYHQFSQLYPVFIFPSVFCIGLTGQSLVVMNGGQSSSQMRDKMAEAFEKLQQEQSGTTPTATPPTPPSTRSPSAAVRNGPITPPLPTPELPISSPPSEGNLVDLAPGPAAEPSSVASGSSTDEPAAATGRSKEKTLKHYQEHIKQRRQEKSQEELQKEKRQEAERRQLGQDVAELRQRQEEQRNQSWIQERRRQKEEEKRAREAVKAQLEQDRLERLAQQREQKATASELRQRSSAAAPVTSSVFSTVSTGGSCRIQLRLPAGGTSVVELKRSGTLGDLREATARDLKEDPSSILLTSMYPRRELVAELDSQSLAELQLVPSGVVIVRLKRGLRVSSVQSGEGGVVSSLWGALVGLLQLIVGFLAYIKSSLVGLFGGSPQPPPTSSQQGGASQREEARVRKFRQEDFRDDDDKDRSTYNGNSTQQQ